MKKAVVVFSGGQDSTTCLVQALARYDEVHAITFDYGQRHRVELTQRPRVLAAVRAGFPDWAERLGEDHELDLSVLGQVAESALTRDMAIEAAASGLPTTFVPGRNLVFLTLAGALAYRRGIDVLVGGMCETDFSGYPDCRETTIQAQSEALALGLDREMQVVTPLMHLTKAETWALAHALGGDALVDLTVEETHTCYEGDRATRHAWGYGCGRCPACELRARGHAEWVAGR